jgi:hypothetical protein
LTHGRRPRAPGQVALSSWGPCYNCFRDPGSQRPGTPGGLVASWWQCGVAADISHLGAYQSSPAGARDFILGGETEAHSRVSTLSQELRRKEDGGSLVTYCAPRLPLSVSLLPSAGDVRDILPDFQMRKLRLRWPSGGRGGRLSPVNVFAPRHGHHVAHFTEVDTEAPTAEAIG